MSLDPADRIAQLLAANTAEAFLFAEHVAVLASRRDEVPVFFDEVERRRDAESKLKAIVDAWDDMSHAAQFRLRNAIENARVK